MFHKGKLDIGNVEGCGIWSTQNQSTQIVKHTLCFRLVYANINTKIADLNISQIHSRLSILSVIILGQNHYLLPLHHRKPLRVKVNKIIR